MQLIECKVYCFLNLYVFCLDLEKVSFRPAAQF